ncbi:MAG: hypothetical protein WBQ25_05355 [Nitrososphaeraceae archaeon]
MVERSREIINDRVKEITATGDQKKAWIQLSNSPYAPPYLCFEIENTTDFINGLVRFNKLRVFDVRFFFVARKDKHIKFENLTKDLPVRFDKDRLRFISYEDLVVLYETTLRCHTNVNELLGQKLSLIY